MFLLTDSQGILVLVQVVWVGMVSNFKPQFWQSKTISKIAHTKQIPSKIINFIMYFIPHTEVSS